MTTEDTEQLNAALKRAVEYHVIMGQRIERLGEGTDEFGFRAAVLDALKILTVETQRLRKEDERLESAK